ncbi:MFS transporter [Kushneria indalinina]|uniref:DHA1 family inner membrane transport protein n=1 Tax=Kushneria indalinina DSM 14324 TaxID=1122140 RepID=A0A3D9DS78_9GAMM|nr:MFS transporter [Kushneria indalinina]REC93610.1 DHA1 family inner membrane transport protein [Kushneria indalinina DSM 14324]
MSFSLMALAIAAFGIGTTEFVIMGLQSAVMADLDITRLQAGLLVSGYAMGVVIGGPILAVISSKMPRKATLMGLMGIFIVGNLACALAPTYSLLMMARVFTALSHGAFFGIGAVTAASMVVPEKRGQAISLMFAGLTLANVLGVPFGTFLGQLAGWRSTFWAVTLIGVIAVLSLWRWVPSHLPRSEGRVLGEFAALKSKTVLMALLCSVLASSSLFAVYSYIESLLTDVTGIPTGWVAWVLLLFGAGLTLGSVVGGRLSGGRLMPPLIGLMLMTAAILMIFGITVHTPLAAMVTLFLWGVVAFALVPILQLLIVDQAVEAPNLASTLNQSAFNLGNAFGAWLGGMALERALPLEDLPWLGSAVMLVALVAALCTWRVLNRRLSRIEAGEHREAQADTATVQ